MCRNVARRISDGTASQSDTQQTELGISRCEMSTSFIMLTCPDMLLIWTWVSVLVDVSVECTISRSMPTRGSVNYLFVYIRDVCR